MQSDIGGGHFHIKQSDKHNLLRPETVESLFVMWRVTANETYRYVFWWLSPGLAVFAYLLCLVNWKTQHRRHLFVIASCSVSFDSCDSSASFLAAALTEAESADSWCCHATFHLCLGCACT